MARLAVLALCRARGQAAPPTELETAKVRAILDDPNERIELRAPAANLLGMAALRAGRFAEARRCFHTEPDLERERGAGDRPLAIAMNNLAVACRELGVLDEAEQWTQQAMGLYEKGFGPNHLHTANALKNLALLRQRQGRRDEALEVAARASTIASQAAPSDHPTVQAIRSVLTAITEG